MAAISNDSCIRAFNNISFALDENNIEKATVLFEDLKTTLPRRIAELRDRIELILAPLRDIKATDIKFSTRFCKESAANIRSHVKSFFDTDSKVSWFPTQFIKFTVKDMKTLHKHREFFMFSQFCQDSSRHLPFLYSIHFYLRGQAQRLFTAEQFATFNHEMMRGLKDFAADSSTEVLITTIQNHYLKPLTTGKNKPSASNIKLIESIIEALKTTEKKFLLLTTVCHSHSFTNEQSILNSQALAIHAYTTLCYVADLLNHFERDFRARIKLRTDDSIENHIKFAFVESDLRHLESLKPDFKQNLIAHYRYLYEDCEKEISHLNTLSYFMEFIKKQFIPKIICAEIHTVVSGKISEPIFNFLEKNASLYTEFFEFLGRFSKGAPHWEELHQKLEFFKTFVSWMNTADLKKLEEEYNKIGISDWPEFIQNQITLFSRQLTNPSFVLAFSSQLNSTTKEQRKSLTVLSNILKESATFAIGILNPYVKISKSFFFDKAPLDLIETVQGEEYLPISDLIDMAKYKRIEYSGGSWGRKYDWFVSFIENSLEDLPKTSQLQRKFKEIRESASEKLVLEKATAKDIPFLKALHHVLSNQNDEKATVSALKKTLTRLTKHEKTLEKKTAAPARPAAPPSIEDDSKDDPNLSTATPRAKDKDDAVILSPYKLITISPPTVYENLPFCIDAYIINLQEKMVAPLQVLCKRSTPKIGLRESIENAKNHIENCLALSSRFYTQMQQRKTSKHLFATVANFAAEASLSLELLLLALDLHHCPSVDSQEEYMEHVPHNHDLIPLLQRLELYLPSINSKDKEIILEANRIEIESRRIAHFSIRDSMTRTQRMLQEAFTCAQHNISFAVPLKTYTDYCRDTFSVIFKLIASFNGERESLLNLKTLERHLNTYSHEMDRLVTSSEVASPTPSRVHSESTAPAIIAPGFNEKQQRVLMQIEEMHKIISELKLSNRIFFCNRKYENILDNFLPRLQVEIERQLELTPAEIRIHYGTILLLNQYIAEELSDIYLHYKGKTQFASHDHDLYARLIALGCPEASLAPLENFCVSGKAIRNIVRYYADRTRFSNVSDGAARAKKHMKASHSVRRAAAAPAAPPIAEREEDGFTPVRSESTITFLGMKEEGLENTLQLGKFIAMMKDL